MRRAHHHLARALGLAMACAPVLASAQTFDVEAMHRRGNDLRAEGRDEEARVVFEQIYQRTREPRALARMALAELALQRWLAAEEHLDAALQFTNDPWIQRTRNPPGSNAVGLETALQQAREHVGRLMVRCPTPDAELWIGDQRVAVLPLSGAVRVLAGETTVEVRAEGHATVRRTITIRGGMALTTEEFALSADGSSSHATPGAGPWPWMVLGAGGVALGLFAVVRFVLYEDAYTNYRNLCGVDCTIDGYSAAERMYANDVNLYASMSDIALGAGAAMVLTGTIWAITSRSAGRPSTPRARTVSLSPSVGVGSWGVSLRF